MPLRQRHLDRREPDGAGGHRGGRDRRRPALSGGYGKVFGAVVGTIIFAVIANLLSLLNVSTFLQDAFRGALILVAVTLATVQFTRQQEDQPDPAGRQVDRFES